MQYTLKKVTLNLQFNFKQYHSSRKSISQFVLSKLKKI